MNELANNHESMKTVVETFLIEETVDLIYDNEKLVKWNNLVSELGLKGQSEIVKPEKSPIPFMHMKASIVNVFSTLCPRKVGVKEFNITPIPLEILDLIALSEREQYFGSIQIWYDDKNPDPACIGVVENWVLHKKGTYDTVPNTPKFISKKDAENYILINGLNAEPYHYSWDGSEKYYLLGRWADVRRPIDELRQMAIKRHIDEQGNALRQEIKERQRKLDDLENDAYLMFN